MVGDLMLPVPDWMVYAAAILAWAAYIRILVRERRARLDNKKENNE
jgi:hypothetical protein